VYAVASSARLAPVVDGHNDLLLMLPRRQRSFFDRGDEGHIDLPRARAGGLAGGFCAIWVPSDVETGRAASPEEASRASFAAFSDEARMPPTPELAESLGVALATMARLFRLEAESEGKLKVVRTAAELDRCVQEGIFAAICHMEGAEAIDPDLDALEVFYRAGLRSIGPVWSRPNRFGRGVPFGFPHTPDTGNGLSDLGRDLVRACNSLHVMVDLSHLNEQGFWDVVEISDAPLVATHSCAWSLSHSPRNLTDKQLDAIRASGGMVGVNFHTGFLRSDGVIDGDTPLDLLAQHFDYLVERLGIDHVGFGSDFDGAVVPAELKDAAGLPKLVDALRSRGYDDDSVNKLTHQNWIRVLRQTWGG
jgi:membrane dipeptidase